MKNSKGIEIKVGLFVFVCLIILAFLLIQFSKGSRLVSSTYDIILNTANVGGLRVQSGVLMSGVKVGSVTKTILSPQGTNVEVYLSINKGQIIRDDAIFKIEQSGFLGDQYVAIYPRKSEGKPLEPGTQVRAEEPFNLQEVAASAGTLIKRMDDTLAKLNATIDDIRKNALSETTLTNFSGSVANLNRVSTSALATVDRVNLLIQTNEAAASLAVSNLVAFSTQLTTLGTNAQGLLDRSAPQIDSALSNVNVSSMMITNLLADVKSGKGVAGALIENTAMAQDVSNISSNLAVTTGNINKLGFWHWIFYKPKTVPTNSPAPATSSSTKKR